MENLAENGKDITADNDDIKDAESSENFEKFIHELFEQNGILNDLRAYLRGHIVNVLKNAESGNPPACHKNFTQRLELTYQALNILVAEYLLRLEFSYSLSVFISEIPLSNMVFEFAKTILKTKDLNVTDMRFGECDIWSVLNYLGIQCDSEHASRIVDMYNESKQSPLLYCILKCITLHDKIPIYAQPVYSSDESFSSDRTVGTDDEKNIKDTRRNILNKCKHYSFCKTCQNRKKRLKYKYEKKINKLEKISDKLNIKNQNVDNFMKAVNVVEQNLIDEMFEQLKTVYEAEVEMVKQDGQKTIKRSIASHARLLQQHREQLEESFKEKEDKLEENIRQKKKFLWGLARALRDQHECMTKAMMEVKFETDRLVEKENDLKNQLQEAEKLIKSKGEKMYNQISQEIKILAAHFESMKKERDNLDKERIDLDNLKQFNDKNDKILEEYKYNKEELKLNYDLLKEQFDVLKKYINESKESKCLVEKGTVMEEKEMTLMNNEVNVRSNDDNNDRVDDKLKWQVMNDFKKKNVNINQLNQEGDRPSSSEADVPEDCKCSDTIHRLKDENERLKKISVQQSEHISALSNERNVLQQQVSRIRTSPIIQHGLIGHRINQNQNIRGGAAGELYAFPNLQSRVLFPGEAVPFLGVMADKRDERRYLLHQWRSLRRRRPVSSPPMNTSNTGQSIQSDPVCSFEKNVPYNIEIAHIQPSTSDTPPVNPKEQHMKPVSHEAKRKQRINIKENTIRREKSPNSTLREAKLRLRKLEIEAEAVEKSYLEFTKRQSELKKVKHNVTLPEQAVLKEIMFPDKPVHSNTSLKIMENNKNDPIDFKESPKLLKKDFDKYLREYQTKYDIGKLHFPNKNSILQKVKPIPIINRKCDEIERNKCINYIETPITEFRKLYQKDNSNVHIDHTLAGTKQNLDKNEFIKGDNKIKCDEQTDLPMPIKSRDNVNDIDKVLYECEKDISFQENIKNTNNDCNKSNLELIDVDTSITNDKIINNQDHDEVVRINNGSLDENIEAPAENMQNQALDVTNDINLKSDDIVIRHEENLLIVEVENVYKESNIKVSESKDLLLVVESSVDNESSEQNKKNVISTQMTIIVSPKNIENNEPKKRLSETVEKITENDVLNDIFHARNNEVSSVELSKKLDNSIKLENSDEYGEDFSADVDNYNSQYEFGNNSPISVAKTSEGDDDFWGS